MGDWDFRISFLVKNPDGTDIGAPAIYSYLLDLFKF